MAGRAPILAAVLALALAGSLGACGGSSDGPLGVAIVDTPEDLYASGLRLSEGGQLVRGATGAGLVALNAQGDIVPALADRWIVADDGKSYIFRLRDGTWPDGTALTGESARQSLRRRIRELRGTSLGLDLAPVDEVRAMAGRVVEIRLANPMPDFLRLLAQPELTLAHGGFSAGPMTIERDKGADAALLALKPPEARGLPEEEGWKDYVRPVAVTALDPRQAVAAFEEGEVDVVLGGTLGSWPLADPGPLSRGTRRLDAAIGLFGLQVQREEGLLAQAANREALAMAIDRAALLAPFNIGGWLPTTLVVPVGVAGEGAAERWDGIEMEALRREAANRIAAWRSGVGEGAPAVVTIDLPDLPGNAALFNGLAQQWAMIGVTLKRVEKGKRADLVLIDRVARFAAPRWFLNQFNCSLRRGACSPEADAVLREALAAEDPQARADGIARAAAMLTATNVYIPLAMPLRWSLVRGDITGFAANPWAWHPLPDLAALPR